MSRLQGVVITCHYSADLVDSSMIPSAIATSSTPGQADDKGLMIAKMVPMQRLGNFPLGVTP